MSEEEKAERERLIKIGDQVVARWEQSEKSGQVSVQTYDDVPRAATMEIDTQQIDASELFQILAMLKQLAEEEKND